MITFCQQYNFWRIYQTLIDDYVHQLKGYIDNPTGIWQDYNVIYSALEQLHRLASVNSKLLCPADIPSYPDPDDYTDLVSSKSIIMSIPIDFNSTISFS